MFLLPHTKDEITRQAIECVILIQEARKRIEIDRKSIDHLIAEISYLENDLRDLEKHLATFA